MECPNCKYEHGYHWKGDDYIETEGEHGDFWELAIKLERRVPADYGDNGKREARVYGCPNCSAVFLSEYT